MSEANFTTRRCLKYALSKPGLISGRSSFIFFLTLTQAERDALQQKIADAVKEREVLRQKAETAESGRLTSVERANLLQKDR